MRKQVRRLIYLIGFIFLAFAIADSIGLLDNKSYYEVPHGSHTHYLPKDCDPPLAVSDAPQRPPGPGQRIDCQGRFVPE